MSYILDALRRAEAERQRGAVPGLHAQPTAAAAAGAAAAPAPGVRGLAWVLMASAALALAGAAGWWLRPSAPPPAAPGSGLAAAPGALPAAPAAVPAPAPAAAVTAAPAAVAAGPSLAVTQPQAPPMDPPPAAGQASRPRPGGPARLAASPAGPAQPLGRDMAKVPARDASAGAAAPGPAQPPVAGKPSEAAPARLPSLADLPEAQKRELGPLVVGGAMHAEQAALRIVILNGQVFHEGDRLGPDLQVQQIRLKSVVLSHRGQRFELPF